MKPKKPDFRVVNAADSATIYLYDVIGEDFWGGISARSFADELGKIKSVKQIDLRINSPGGSVFEGNAMYTLLKSHGANISVFVDGVAASIASVIAMAGDEIEISTAGMFMIHDPSGRSYGTAAEMRKTADLLDKVRDNIVETYAARTGKDHERLSAMMAEETWFSASEATAFGLADRVGEQQAIAAYIDPQVFRYRNVPKNLTTPAEPEPQPVTVENELRRQILSLK